MTEKQRWLLKELETWQTATRNRMGHYSPTQPTKEPAAVRAARRVAHKANVIIQAEERRQRAIWEKRREVLNAQSQIVKRAILFGTTAEALKALAIMRGEQ